MNFLIGKVSQDQLETMDTDDLFQMGEEYFFYTLEFQEDEMVRITDSVGRTMPIDIGEVAEFAEIFRRITQFQEGKEMYQQKLFMELTEGEQY